jgi:hypothetical protein
MIKWLHQHKFESHLLAFALMVLTSIGLYTTVDADQAGWTWAFLAGFILANIAAMLVK